MRDAIDALTKQLDEIKARCIREDRPYDDGEKKLIKQIQSRIEGLQGEIEGE